MRLKLNTNLGSLQFPDLVPLPVAGEVHDFNAQDAALILRKKWGVEVDEPKKPKVEPPVEVVPPVVEKAKPEPAKADTKTHK